MEEEKVFFSPGDLVRIKKDLPNKPIMMVIKKETSMFKHKNSKEGILKGIRCIWFTANQEPQEYIFNTKDIEKIN